MRKRRERGSQFVEAGLMLVPFLALAFLALDAGWAVFIKATLQHAVREGTRYAVTGQTQNGLGQSASIQAVVKQYALGLLDGGQANTLTINCWNPAKAKPSPADATQCGVGGNVVEVSVQSYQISPLASLLRPANPVPVTVSAADIVEGASSP
jgi:Flp pilus assembly protein TadG